jgi:hypothetical protein
MIQFFKLWNGEEVTADVDDTEDWQEKVDLRRPFRNVMTQKGMMLVPYPCDSITLRTHHIVFQGSPNADLSNAYRQATGGVVVPSVRPLELPGDAR